MKGQPGLQRESKSSLGTQGIEGKAGLGNMTSISNSKQDETCG